MSAAYLWRFQDNCVRFLLAMTIGKAAAEPEKLPTPCSALHRAADSATDIEVACCSGTCGIIRRYETEGGND